LQPQSGVLIIGNFMPHHVGSRGVCEDLAEQLSAAGWRVITSSAETRRLARLVDMIATTWRRRSDYHVAYVDVFSGAAFLWAEAVTWLLRRAGRPYVLTLRGGNLPVFAQRWPGRVRRLLARADAVTAPSAYFREQMVAFRPDIEVIPSPITLSNYARQTKRNGTPQLIWLRAFQQIYNPVLAVKVLQALLPEYPSLRLTMVGPDKGDGTFQEVERLAQASGIQRQVDLPGSVPKSEVPKWLKKGDIFLNTTHIDNTPVSVMEAMAAGLSIVSTRVGGVPFLLEHEVDSLLVPPDDLVAMTAAVRRLLSETPLSEQLAAQAQAKAAQFDKGQILPRWEQLFEQLMDAKT
jgi:glycosyltransferase involved in cell wall biosynthesis